MSARRQARASASVPPVSIAGGEPLDVLRDPDAAVWHDQKAFHALMAEHGWTMPGIERLGGRTHPANRRSAAAAAWASENGVAGGGTDWHELRRMGLIT